MRVHVLVILALLLYQQAPGQQCPERTALWDRIILLRDSETIAPEKQLEELSGYLAKMDLCTYRNDSTHALLLQRIGWLYFDKKDFVNAIQYTERAIALIDQQKSRPDINPGFAAKCYWNLFIIYDSLQLTAKKEAAIDSCISRALKLHTNFDDYAVGAFQWKVRRLFESGDYYRCIRYAELGESFIRDMNPPPLDFDYYDIEFFTWKINAYNFLKETAPARKLLQDKISIFEKSNNAAILGSLHSLYGKLLFDNDQPSGAIANYNKAYKYNLSINHRIGCAQALNNIGFTYSSMLHQYKAAYPYFTRALKFSDANESLNIFDNIANLYVQWSKYDSAFYFFRKGFDQVAPGLDESSLLTSEVAGASGSIIEYVTGLLLDKANACLLKYKAGQQQTDLLEAIRIYKITDRYFEKIKAGQSEVQSKLFWRINYRRLYERAIEACHLKKDAEMAFYFFEKSRSVLLNDQIREIRRLDKQALAKQALLKRNLLAIERGLQNAKAGSKEYLALQQQLYSNKQEQELLLRNAFRRNAPGAPDTISLSIGLVQKKILGGNKSMMEIFSGDSAVYVISVSPDNVSFVKLNKPLYDSLATAYISFVTNPDKLNGNFGLFAAISHQLYGLIFNHLQLHGTGSLIISPDGKNFPYEALITEPHNRNPGYLLNNYAVSYTYSAKYLANEYTNAAKSGNSILGIAPVQYNGTGLAALPGSDVSLEYIKKKFSGAINFVSDKATRRNFLQNFSDYPVLQLYAHAADSSINADPVIYFADSAFYLSDLITDRQPVTQLVVLSACETANGKLYEGEGIFSFNRGFASLGIPAAISNLWSVDNESTYKITELFYKYLALQYPTDVALQKAKIEFMETSTSLEKTAPYYWAGPILTGKVDTIRLPREYRLTTIVLATSVILGIIILAYYLRKRYVSRKKALERSDRI